MIPIALFKKFLRKPKRQIFLATRPKSFLILSLGFKGEELNISYTGKKGKLDMSLWRPCFLTEHICFRYFVEVHRVTLSTKLF